MVRVYALVIRGKVHENMLRECIINSNVMVVFIVPISIKLIDTLH